MCIRDRECTQQIESTSAYIRETLGEVVFGENDDRLCDVTTKLLSENELSVSFIDFQFGSAAASLLREGLSPGDRDTLLHFSSLDSQSPQQWVEDDSLLDVAAVEQAAIRIQQQTSSKIGIAIGKLSSEDGDDSRGKFPVAISFEGNANPLSKTFRFGGHSSMRIAKSANQVVDFLRLTLLSLRS